MKAKIDKAKAFRQAGKSFFPIDVPWLGWILQIVENALAFSLSNVRTHELCLNLKRLKTLNEAAPPNT